MYYFWNRISTSDQFRLELLTTVWPSSRFLHQRVFSRITLFLENNRERKKYFYEIFKPYIYSSFSLLPIGNFSKNENFIYTLIIPFFFFFLIIHTEERIDTEFYSNFFVKYAGKRKNSFPLFKHFRGKISHIYLLWTIDDLNELKYSLHFVLYRLSFHHLQRRPKFFYIWHNVTHASIIHQSFLIKRISKFRARPPNRVVRLFKYNFVDYSHGQRSIQLGFQWNSGMQNIEKHSPYSPPLGLLNLYSSSLGPALVQFKSGRSCPTERLTSIFLFCSNLPALIFIVITSRDLNS